MIDAPYEPPLVYIAAPYGSNPVHNTHQAIRFGLTLYEEKLAIPLVPHLTLLADIVEPRTTDYWYEFDLHQLIHCDALLRLPGDSVGADREVQFCKDNGIPYFFVDKFLLPLYLGLPDEFIKFCKTRAFEGDFK